MIHKVNSTNIILIPTNNNLYLINHFRPISLCNVLYKIISSIIVELIRSLMDYLGYVWFMDFKTRKRKMKMKNLKILSVFGF